MLQVNAMTRNAMQPLHAKTADVASETGQAATAPGLILARPSVQNLRALAAPRLQFGLKLLDDDYVVEHRIETPVNAFTSARTLRFLMMRDLIKRDQGDTGKLKYSLNADQAFLDEHEAALGDNMVLLDRGVDTVIQGHAGPATVFALMMSRVVNDMGLPPEERSKCYMSQNATLRLGPVTMGLSGKNHDQQINRENANESVRDKESLIMMVTGETDREKIYFRDMNSRRQYNSLQALWYGKHGLVDAILVGHDKVLTRENLERYYTSRGWMKDEGGKKVVINENAIEKFNNEASNLSKLANSITFRNFLTPLPKYSQGSIVPVGVKNHPRRSNPIDEGKKASLESNADNQADTIKGLAGQYLQVSVGGLFDEKTKFMDKLSMRAVIENGIDVPLKMKVRGAMPSPGLIYDDLIYFSDGFTDSIAEQFSEALKNLQKKKSKQKDPSHIKILLDSPGGYVSAGRLIRNAISELPSNLKVDVIVQGIAASCGAWLLASATGNKFATPFARIMVHQAASGHSGTVALANQEADNIQNTTDEIAGNVAKVSGRSFDAVRKDFRQDTYLNALEAMFYGPKGLVDGILVGPDRVITRKDVEEYLRTDPDMQAYLNERFAPPKYKSEDKVKLYIQDHLRKLRDPDRIHEPDKWIRHKGHNPFENPIQVILAVSSRARPIAEIEQLKGSATRPQPEIEQYVLGRKP